MRGARVSFRPRVSPHFPIAAHAGGKRYVDADGNAFLIGGRKCGLIYRLGSIAAYESILENCVANGFTTIEVKLPIAASPDNGNGQDDAGNLPFLKALDGSDWDGNTGQLSGVDWVFPTASTDAADFSTPNEAYWVKVDRFFAATLAFGLLVNWFPAFTGFYQRDWWMLSIAANGASKMQTYGAFLANRYQHQRNIQLMLGGDKGTGGVSGQFFTTAEEDALEGFHAGLKSVSTTWSLYSAQWERGSIAKDLFPSDITSNGTYAAATSINAQGERAWDYSPQVPAFCHEYPFATGSENIGYLTVTAWLTTAGGFVIGQHVFTDFDGAHLAQMDAPSTLHARRLLAFIKSINYHLLEPDNAAITAGGGTPNTSDQVVAAFDPAGSLGLVFCPPDHSGTVTINMTRMAGSTTSQWWDGDTGAITADGSGLSNTGTRAFTKPGANTNGWLLKLTA